MKRMLLTTTAAVCVAAGLCAGTSTAGAQATGATSAQDQTWLTTSIQGDRFEIEGGRLAERRSADPRVRAIGRRLVKDHSKSLQDAGRAAAARGIDVPKHPSPSETWELDVLRGLRGAAFDRAYLTLEVKDHEQDISESEDESRGGNDPVVVGLAREDLPILRTHLKLCRAALRHR